MNYTRYTDKLIRDIKRALPAANYRELTISVNQIRKHRHVNKGAVQNAVAKLRKMATVDPLRYGWTIPHTRRGTNDDETNKRLFAVSIDRNGDIFIPEDRRSANLFSGNAATLQSACQQFVNQSASFRMALEYHVSPARKRQIRSIINKLNFLTIEIAEMIEEDEVIKNEIIDVWRGAA